MPQISVLLRGLPKPHGSPRQAYFNLGVNFTYLGAIRIMLFGFSQRDAAPQLNNFIEVVGYGNRLISYNAGV